MTLGHEERRSVRRLGLVVVAVGATLLPVAILLAYIQNLLTGDPPAYGWVIGFGFCLISGLLGSALFGIHLWDEGSQNSRRLTLSLVGVGIASVTAFVPAAFIMIP